MTTSNSTSARAKKNGVIPKGPARTKFLIGGLIIPLLILGVLSLFPLTWLDQLPAQVPSHWGLDGQPDTFESPLTLIWTMVGIGGGTIAGMWGIGFALGKELLTRRIVVGANIFMAVLMGGIVWSTLSAARAGSSGDMSVDSTIFLAMGIGTALGVLGAVLVRPEPLVLATGHPSAGAPRTPLSELEVGVWVTRTEAKTGYLIAAGTALLTIGIMIATQLWWTSIMFILLSVTMVVMFSWNVRVDSTGLTVASVARVPKRQLHLDEIESAEVADVRAMADFGGYGLRTGFSGSTGVILRSGKALQVNLSGNRTFYITIDDAEIGAALLNTLVERSRPAANE